MTAKEGYLQRVTVLGRYCYQERAEETLRIVLSCLKCALPVEADRKIFAVLPEPVSSMWESTTSAGPSPHDDCVAMAKELGGYPYRAAAEKAFEVIFASLREIMDEVKIGEMMEFLPSPLKILFVRSQSCALDRSAEDFL